MADDKSNGNDDIQQTIDLSLQIYGRPFVDWNHQAPRSYHFQDLEMQENSSAKSLQKGLFFSLLLPGAGEFYANSWIKGAVFLGIEVAAWTTYASNHKKGKDLEEEFKAYAEEYWSYDRWNQWWSSLPEETRQQLAHHTLPETKTQQYYEIIGKYQKFNAGWDDVPAELAFTDTSEIGRYYMSIRGRSNDKLKLASAMTGLALANHVLSALDAVWTVNRLNKKVEPAMRVRYTTIDGRPAAVANLRVSW